MAHPSEPFSLPNLATKVTVHYGYVVTILQSNRIFGDAINYCARVAGDAFNGLDEGGIALTEDFVSILPVSLRELVQRHQIELTDLRYPKKEGDKAHLAYVFATFYDALWQQIGRPLEA